MMHPEEEQQPESAHASEPRLLKNGMTPAEWSQALGKEIAAGLNRNVIARHGPERNIKARFPGSTFYDVSGTIGIVRASGEHVWTSGSAAKWDSCKAVLLADPDAFIDAEYGPA